MPAFPQDGLDAAVAACQAALTAAYPGGATPATRLAFVRAFAAGMSHGMPLDELILTSLVSVVGTAGQFDQAVALKEDYDAKLAADAAADAAAATADAARNAAVAAADTAINTFAP